MFAIKTLGNDTAATYQIVFNMPGTDSAGWVLAESETTFAGHDAAYMAGLGALRERLETLFKVVPSAG